MLAIDELSQMVKKHLGFHSDVDGIIPSSKWVIGESAVGERGLIATEDISIGEVIFVDRPLLQGPRSGTIIQRGCNVCGKINENGYLKCLKCALFLCSEECEMSDKHCNDCAVISRWSNKIPIEDVDSSLVSRTLTAIRALLLNDEQKCLLQSLEAHHLPQHGSEIRQLKQYFDIPEEDEEFLLSTCGVLDANAFQIATPYRKKEMSMRGLYPVAALMNHSCVPNTKHTFNGDSMMIVKAVKHIPAGSEIFTCYTGFLWGTPARRLHLYKTKHFLCMCDRCADPTERGTLLAALKCFSSECPGSLLPVEPFKSLSPWRCIDCGLKVPSTNVTAVQNALGSLMGTANFENVQDLEYFLLKRITKYIPESNQIFIELQCRLIWELGESDGQRWYELSDSQLSLKENFCRSILRIVTALDAGDAHLRGLLLYHLHATLAERARRSPDLYEELKAEIENAIEKAYNILQDDISAPPDLELRLKYLGPGCDTPKEERFLILDA